VLVLRSMTKDFALAGLRLGYAVGAEELIASLARVRPPWSVNALAQAAGVAALHDREHLARSLELLAAAKGELMAALTALGMRVLPSAAPFFLVRVGDGAAVRLALLRQGILVRDCASFGLPEFIRICPRRPEENARLVAALREVIR
jgi:histidinol-phosphate/aromatic aminotransferase/cobyric acid decarboxylase-like protein